MAPLRMLPNIALSPWNWDGIVLAGGTHERFVEFVLDFMGEELGADEDANGRAFLCPDEPWLLWVADLADIPTLSHEAFHIVTGVLTARGVPLADASEEAYAYTLSDILRQTLEAPKRAWKRLN